VTFLKRFILIFLYSLASGAELNEYSLNEYEKLFKVTELITETYPPGEYLYVGVGGSPTGILAMMEYFLGVSNIAHLPLAGQGRLYDDGEGGRINQDHPLYKTFIRRLGIHFNRFLPPKAYEGRKILLIDFISSGQGITDVRDELKSYFGRRKITAEVEALAMHNERTSGIAQELVRDGVLTLELELGSIGGNLSNEIYDTYRKYEKFNTATHLLGRRDKAPRLIDKRLKRQIDLKEFTIAGTFIGVHGRTYDTFISEIDQWADQTNRETGFGEASFEKFNEAFSLMSCMKVLGN